MIAGRVANGRSTGRITPSSAIMTHAGIQPAFEELHHAPAAACRFELLDGVPVQRPHAGDERNLVVESFQTVHRYRRRRRLCATACISSTLMIEPPTDRIVITALVNAPGARTLRGFRSSSITCTIRAPASRTNATIARYNVQWRPWRLADFESHALIESCTKRQHRKVRRIMDYGVGY